MEIAKPTDSELAALLAEHQHRFPEKARFTVADGEADVALPVLIGNPSGACKMPPGRSVSPAWDATVAATFKLRHDTKTVTDLFVADCVLWPDAATWSTWTKRWPALPEIVQVAIRRKAGASMAMIEEPAPTDERPAALVPVLERHAGSVWRRLRPLGAEFDAVIAPPDSGVWRMFITEMRERGTQAAKLAADLATSCLLAVVKPDGMAITTDELLTRWPGFVLTLGLTISYLAGLGAEYELGNW